MHGDLNKRQQTVLDWVGQGCPDGVWPDSTFKVSAQALQSRGLRGHGHRRRDDILQHLRGRDPQAPRLGLAVGAVGREPGARNLALLHEAAGRGVRVIVFIRDDRNSSRFARTARASSRTRGPSSTRSSPSTSCTRRSR